LTRWIARQAFASVPTRSPLGQQRGLPTRNLSSFDVQAFHLTVYLRRLGSPQHDARLFSGCWPSLPCGLDSWFPREGFRVCSPYIHPPVPRLTRAHDTLFRPQAGTRHLKVSSRICSPDSDLLVHVQSLRVPNNHLNLDRGATPFRPSYPLVDPGRPHHELRPAFNRVSPPYSTLL